MTGQTTESQMSVDNLIHAAKEWKSARSGEISWERLANAEHDLVKAVAALEGVE